MNRRVTQGNWNATKQLLHIKPASSVSADEYVVMPSAFCQLFIDKIARISQPIAKIEQTFDGYSFPIFRSFVGSPLNACTNVSSTEVFELIDSMPTKYSRRDEILGRILPEHYHLEE